MRAALYMRLSREDGGGESESISTQRLLLRDWCARNGAQIAGEYIDDGYSGVSFRRPGFCRMISDIEAGLIDTVIVKDLSRLGRDYIAAGQYTELWFPAHGVRFIALNDGYDSREEDNDLVPLKNIINELYARDTSRKIRSAFRARMAAGDFVGPRPPYGYRRMENDRHRLEPDPDKARVVRQIFTLACTGLSCAHIAERLSRMGIPSPGGGQWCASTLRKMLRDRVYLGHLRQGKTRKASLKSRSLPAIPIVLENAHQAIISPGQFEQAGRMISSRASRRGSFRNIFSGIAFCADCGSGMSSVSSRRGGGSHDLCCGSYKSRGKDCCTNHFTDYEELCRRVLEGMKEPPDAHDGLTRALLCREVRRIEIHQGHYENGKKVQSIDIIWA